MCMFVCHVVLCMCPVLPERPLPKTNIQLMLGKGKKRNFYPKARCNIEIWPSGDKVSHKKWRIGT